jgi:hypothetical protein
MGIRPAVSEIFGVETFCVSGYTSGYTRRIVITFEQHTTIWVSRHHEKIFYVPGESFSRIGVEISETPPNVKVLFTVRFRSFSSG